VLQPKLQGQFAKKSERNVIPGYKDLLKTVAALEISERVLLLLAVGKVGVPEMRNLALGAAADRLRNQRVRDGFIAVLEHRKDVHKTRLAIILVRDQLCKADERLLEERTDKDASVEERRFDLPQTIKISAIVSKASSLPNRAFVIDGLNSPE
jgi:hypothetical protein